MVDPHDHACARCGHTWHCSLILKPKQKVCPVDAAVKVNKSGPVCGLCHHLAMAARFAAHQQVTGNQFASLAIECWMEASG